MSSARSASPCRSAKGCEDPVIWDGDDFEQELAVEKERSARLRSEARRDAAARQRQQARRHFARQQLRQQRWLVRQASLAEDSDVVPATPGDGVGSEGSDERRLGGLGSLVLDLLGPDGRPPGASTEAGGDGEDSPEAHAKIWKKASAAMHLLAGRFAQPRKVAQHRRGAIFLGATDEVKSRIRMINELAKMRRRQTRLAKLLLVRREEFERKPLAEQEALRKAFHAGHGDETGTMSSKCMRRALEELGISARSDVEKKELKILCDEICVVEADFFVFCFEAVPRARELLRDLRRAPLLQDFLFYDTDKSGKLDEEECLRILARLYMWNLDTEGCNRMRQAFHDILRSVRLPGTSLCDFEGFEKLLGRSQEAYHWILTEREGVIRAQEGLGDEDMENHADEVLYLFDTFAREAHRERRRSSGGGDGEDHGQRQLIASVEDVRRMVVEFALLPDEDDDMIRFLFTRVDADRDGLIDFRGFLLLVRQLRACTRRLAREELQTVFAKFDKDRSGILTIGEVNALVSEMGLMPQCREDQAILRRLITQVDKDSSDNLTFEEFQVFVQRLSERMYAVQSCRERREGLDAGFSEKEVAELRDAFYMLDTQGTGRLGVDALSRAMQLIRRRSASLVELRRLLERFDEDKTQSLRFGQFVKFVRAMVRGAEEEQM